MNEELKQLLETAYGYEIAAQTEDDAEAEVARKAGAMEAYFDLSMHLTLPDTCWALEKWDEAKHWYRHNAKVIVEKRQWHAQHSGPDYPIEAMLDLEAMTIVKAGDLDQGREYIRRAIEHWLKKPGNQLVLTKLGLHAAQAGMDDLAQHALAVIEARQALPGAKEAEQARKSLHYEPAQVNLMLGRWNEFEQDVKALELVAQQVAGSGTLVFPEPLQVALLAASRGFRALLNIRTGDAEVQRQNARTAFEEAMLNFYKFSGRVEWNLYFMRLNTRFADELAVGQQIKVNPFTDESGE